MSNDEFNEWTIYENKKRAETDYLCKIFEKKVLNPRKKGRLKQHKKAKRKKKCFKIRCNYLTGRKLSTEEEIMVKKYTVGCYVPIRSSDFANLIQSVELYTTGDENMDPMSTKSLDEVVENVETRKVQQRSDKPVVIIGKSGRCRTARFSVRKKNNTSVNNIFGLPVDRSIRHRWVDNDDITRDYLGRIIQIDTEGTCSITYEGSVDVYRLTVHELYTDYLNGDLDFE